MKKLALLLISGSLAAGTLSSCQKCTVCTAPTLEGDVVVEYCGAELDVRTYEDNFIDSLDADGIVGYCDRGPDN